MIRFEIITLGQCEIDFEGDFLIMNFEFAFLLGSFDDGFFWADNVSLVMVN